MEAYSLDCPNCGAPLGVAPGDTAVVCSHCGSDIRITSDRSAVPFFHTEARHGPQVDQAAVRRALAAGRKIDAVKLVREQTGLGLKEALETVEAIEREEEPRQVAPARVEQVRRRMAQLPQGSGSGAGCTRIAIGIAVFIMLLLAGCGQFVRSTALHACAVELISENSTLRQDLGSPITVSSLLLVMGYSSETDFGGNTDRSAGYFTIARGSQDSAWLYVEAYEASSGFYGVRFNPVPNPNDWLFSHSGDIAECNGFN
jgi:hypothetical protein